MNLHPHITNWAPRLGFVTDLDENLKAHNEASEYEFQKISPDFFLCEHGDNAYVIAEKGKTIGCSCPAMTFRKTHADGCKHIIAYAALQTSPTAPVSSETEALLQGAGWTGDPLHPPATPKQEKKKLPNIKDPARKPGKQAPSRADRHERYQSMTPEQIIAGMSDAELASCAKRGAEMAIDEQERRKGSA